MLRRRRNLKRERIKRARMTRASPIPRTGIRRRVRRKPRRMRTTKKKVENLWLKLFNQSYSNGCPTK